jgi:sarcosine oxidase / L-pipecolate oxidase
MSFSALDGMYNSSILFFLTVTSLARIFGTDGEVSGNRAANFDRAYSNTRNFGDASKIIDFPNWDAVVSSFPVLAHPSHSENKSRFRGLFNGNAGWVKSMDAMAIVKRECENLGVKFETGVKGTVVELLREGSGNETVTGVQTEDGKEWFAEKVVLATGSYSDTLLDFEGQLIAVISATHFDVPLCSKLTQTGYCVSHVKMTEEQYQRYKHIPVLNMQVIFCHPIELSIPFNVVYFE